MTAYEAQWARFLRYSQPNEKFSAWLERTGETRVPHLTPVIRYDTIRKDTDMKMMLWAIIPATFATFHLSSVLPGIATFAVIVVGALWFEQVTRRI